LRKAIQIPETSRSQSSVRGGLLHQVSGERAGFNNLRTGPWVLELLEKGIREKKLTELSHRRSNAKRGGIEARKSSCG